MGRGCRDLLMGRGCREDFDGEGNERGEGVVLCYGAVEVEEEETAVGHGGWFVCLFFLVMFLWLFDCLWVVKNIYDL